MKKNYLISFLIISLVLIVTVVTVGLIASNQLKKEEDSKYYKIGEVKVLSIKEVCEVGAELKNYNYTFHSQTYSKYYEYKITNAEAVVYLYAEYLTVDENFELNIKDNKLTLKKIVEEDDECKIEILYDNNKVELLISYTYIN